MESKDNEVKRAQVVEARVRNINHNVRCTECGSQSIEDSQADIAILLRKLRWYSLGRNQVWRYRGHTYPDNYFMLHIYVAPTRLCVRVLDLSMSGSAAGIWAFKKHRQKTNGHIMALDLVRGVPLTPKEK